MYNKWSKSGGITRLAAFPSLFGLLVMLYSLPLTPPLRLDEAMELIMIEINDLNNRYNMLNNYDENNPLYDELKLWMMNIYNYVNSTWLQNSSFDISSWNHYDSENFEHLTNNCAESGNRRLKARCVVAHPHFYRFISILRNEMDQANIRIQQIEDGNSSRGYSQTVKVILILHPFFSIVVKTIYVKYKFVVVKLWNLIFNIEGYLKV